MSSNNFRIGTKIAVDGEADFKKAVANINSSLKVLQSEAKKNTVVFSDNKDEMKKLQLQSENMTAQVRTQKEKISLLNSALENAKEEYGENSREVDSWKIKLNAAEVALYKVQKALDENDNALAELQKSQQKSGLDKLKDTLEAVKDKFKIGTKSVDDMGDGLETAGQKGLKFGDILKANVIGDVITSGLKKVGSLIGQIAQKFGDFVKSGIENASDLAEVQNVVNVTFGNSAKEIDKFAKSAAASYGMSELSAKQYSGTMGAMLKSMGLADDAVLSMSTSMVGLAGDMASFYNLDHETAFNKIRSGISGETEPLKQLGINMSVANLNSFALSQGIGKTYDSMTQAEQATLRYNYLMSVTADAQGDFARTADSYANQQKILKLNMENLATSIGSKLLPFLTQGTTAINGMLSGTMSLDEGMKALGGVITTAVNELMGQLPTLLNVGGEMVTALVTGISQNLEPVINSAIELVFTLFNGIVNNLDPILAGAVFLITALVGALADNLDKVIGAAFTIINSLVSALLEDDNLSKLIDSAVRLVLELAAGLIENVPRLASAAIQLIKGIVTGLWDNRGLVIDALKRIASAMLTAFKNFFGIHSPSTVFAGLGKNLLEGLWNGISNMKNWLVNKIKSLGSTVTEALKQVLGIHSPSTVFRDQIGKNLALGVGVGFENTMKSVSRKMMNSIPMSVDFNATSGVENPATGVSVVVNIQHFNNNRAEDVREFAREVSEMITFELNRKEAAYG